MSTANDDGRGVLLLAYGGPLALAEVEPFLADIRGGRPAPPELVAEVRSRYAAISGRSPLLDNTWRQAAALERSLDERGVSRPVAVGMRHWQPRIADALRDLADRGVSRLVAICLAPHYSQASIGAYRQALDDALDAAGIPFELRFVERWGAHPRLIAALADRLQATLDGVPAPLRRHVRILFTAHSLPARLAAEGDPYCQELEATAEAVARRLRLADWSLAFQSAGARPVEWLEPDVLESLHALAADGARCAVVQPIGFVSDHVETLYDLDVEARRHADSLGLAFHRVAAAGDHPDLIAALADLVLHDG
ncbi:MAG: ferrochelatase [Thermoanaerobaculia bacterium]